MAVITGCLVGVAGSASFGWLFPVFVPSVLVIGALIQPRFLRLGRGLICAGALWISFWVFGFAAMAVAEGGLFSTGVRIADTVLFASVLLVAWCDVTLGLEEGRLHSRSRVRGVQSEGVNARSI